MRKYMNEPAAQVKCVCACVWCVCDEPTVRVAREGKLGLQHIKEPAEQVGCVCVVCV